MGEFHLLIVGGGPGGMAPLLAAHRMGQLGELLQRGVGIIEKSDSLGAGSIGGYAINSDSSGRTFVDCLLADEPSEVTRLDSHPLTQQIAAAGDGTVTLRDAGSFLGLVGNALARMIEAEPESAVLTRHSAVKAIRVSSGWHVEVRDERTGQSRMLRTRHLVIATGGHQPVERLAMEKIGDLSLVEAAGDRLMQSGDVLTTGGLEKIAGILADRPAPKVAVIGGSTSAAAVAHALLHRLPTVAFGEGGVTLLHRRELRIFYPDRESALREGYSEWTEDDVCPISGRVFRLAGFRLDSRELIMQVRGLGGRPPEPRLRLHRLAPDDAAAKAIIGAADIVVAALGLPPAFSADHRAEWCTPASLREHRPAEAPGRQAMSRARRQWAAGARAIRHRTGRGLRAERSLGWRSQLPRTGQRALALAARCGLIDREGRVEVRQRTTQGDAAPCNAAVGLVEDATRLHSDC